MRRQGPKESAATRIGSDKRASPSLEELEQMRRTAIAQRRAGDVEELNRMIRLRRQGAGASARLRLLAAAVVGILVLIWILWIPDDPPVAKMPDAGLEQQPPATVQSHG